MNATPQNPPDFIPYVLPFIGTAAQALDRVNVAISQAQASHMPVKALHQRRRKLVARCVALGAEMDVMND